MLTGQTVCYVSIFCYELTVETRDQIDCKLKITETKLTFTKM